MKQNFDDCLNRVLKDEGGYSNDPSDSGGPTNYGITLGDYRKYINSKGTAEDVKRMTISQAKEIYRERYWNAMDCDTLCSGVDYTCFDYAVNSGLGRPRKALQKFSDKKGTDLINAINDERTAFLKALATNQPKDQKFLKGWLSRVNRVRSHSLDLAKSNKVVGPVVASTGTGAVIAASHHYLTHPWLVAGIGVAVAVAIGFAVHYYLNRK